MEDKFVYYRGEAFDVSNFINGHPGGPELIEKYLGQDITEAFDNAGHGNSAFSILSSLRVAPDVDDDFDIDKPIIAQIAKMNKTRYLKLIDSPLHPKRKSIRMFYSDWLEPFSGSPWWMIPTMYIPWALWSISLEYITPLDTLIHLFMGLFVWSFLEYSLHRFAFHSQDQMPDNQFGVMAHFFLHGIHHIVPMDPYRLVYPPALGVPSAILVRGLLCLIFNSYNLVFAGMLMGYTAYDCMHYWIHHCTPKFSYVKDMQEYHLDHHYSDGEGKYGITSKLWDYIMNTTEKL